MTNNEVKAKYQQLSADLKDALSHMERSDRVFLIRDEIKQLQAICPHSNGTYDFSDQANCPYCGKKFRK